MESGTYMAKMKSGLAYRIRSEAWNLKADYYLEFFVYHLGDIIAELKQAGNPIKRVLEMGIARGVLSVGVALLTDDDTRIVGIDIEENARTLVEENATANGVEHKIEVRIGNMFQPVKPTETFDLIMSEPPALPVAPSKQREYIEQGYAFEIQNVSGGPNGRCFLDSLISHGSQLLNPGGAIVSSQSSFLGVAQTIDLFAQHGCEGSLVASKEWILRTTKFTRENKAYIETVNNYNFPKNKRGEDIFFLNIMKGVKKFGCAPLESSWYYPFNVDL